MLDREQKMHNTESLSERQILAALILPGPACGRGAIRSAKHEVKQPMVLKGQGTGPEVCCNGSDLIEAFQHAAGTFCHTGLFTLVTQCHSVPRWEYISHETSLVNSYARHF